MPDQPARQQEPTPLDYDRDQRGDDEERDQRVHQK